MPTSILFYFFNAAAIFYLLVSLIIFFYTKHNKENYILHILIFLIIAVLIDHLSTILSMFLFYFITSELLFIILRNIMFISLITGCAYLYKRFIKKAMEQSIVNTVVKYLLIFIIFITLIFIYMNIFKMVDRSSLSNIKVNLIAFLIYVFFLVVICASIIYISLKQYKLRYEKEQYENFQLYVKNLENVNRDMQKFKHDYINILSSIRYYIDDKDYEGLENYFYAHILQATKEDINNNSVLFHLNNLNISEIKGLLITKILIAQSYNIPVHLEVLEEIDKIEMDPILLNRAMGILLDNAIEASKPLVNPQIQLAFIKLDHSILFVIMNRIDSDLELNILDIYQDGFSTKGLNRGIGLSNLRKIVNSSDNVLLNTKIQKNYLVQELEIQEVIK